MMLKTLDQVDPDGAWEPFVPNQSLTRHDTPMIYPGPTWPKSCAASYSESTRFGSHGRLHPNVRPARTVFASDV
jgi:hypothetical protein